VNNFPDDSPVVPPDIAERIAVVVPAYRVVDQIVPLLTAIPRYVWRIYVVDDGCPERSGHLVEHQVTDTRVVVLYHEVNQGVGAAVLTGYHAAIADGASVIVKLDGDGQMDPELVLHFVEPVLAGEADYVKGNRFFDLEHIRSMPAGRIFGNVALSFLAKLSTGYWDLFDPTNGYTAIDAGVAKLLPLDKISRRYFFETDLLFRLNTMRAVVVDMPMDAKYADEVSSLRIRRVVGTFLVGHLRNFVKRIFYCYYLRDMSAASIELPLGLSLCVFGVAFGLHAWAGAAAVGASASAGTVMLAALPVLMGLQLLLAFLNYDVASVPRRPLSGMTRRFRSAMARDRQ
jgi:dolichol-phosphate mannosyltransferase